MTVRKLNQLIKIAEEYKMYPLVHYYKLKIKYVQLENKYKKLTSVKSSAGHSLTYHRNRL